MWSGRHDAEILACTRHKLTFGMEKDVNVVMRPRVYTKTEKMHIARSSSESTRDARLWH
jgi:hypothetical protein